MRRTTAAGSTEKDALGGLDDGWAKRVVGSDALGSGGAEEKTAEENEGEGAHLRGEWGREDEVEKDGQELTSSVPAEVAN